MSSEKIRAPHGPTQTGESANALVRLYPWYVVGVLMLCYALSFIDRLVLSLLVQPIKRDLEISDTQFGLLQGVAFALFYTFVGLYMGKLADTRNRRRLIAAGVATWSFMTALCGLAGNFLQLFAARAGVAVGEAALSPAAYSIIGDYFPATKRGRAMSVYTVGIFLGSGLAFVLGGTLIAMIPDPLTLPLVGELRSWQAVFIAIGLPGALFALLVLSIREPARGRYSKKTAAQNRAAAAGTDTLLGSLAYFAKSWPFYSTHFLGFSMITGVGYAFHAWVPAYFIRVLEWEASQVGLVYGTISLVCAPAGVLSGGWIGDHLLRRGRGDAHMRTPVFGALLLFFPAALATTAFSPGVMTTLALLGALQFFASFHAGLAVASLHEVTPINLRARATALYLFVINIVGLGLGPLLVAIITDYVFGDEAAVGQSLAITGAAASALAFLLLLYANRHYVRRKAQIADLA